MTLRLPTCSVCGDSHLDEPGCVPRSLAGRIGQVLDERYQLVRLLGAGGMGEVYEARHRRIQRRYAVKFLLPEYAANRDLLQRFFNEVEAAGRLTHLNIAAAIDMGVAPDGAPYMVLELLDGCDADVLLKQRGPLPIGRAVDITVQACRGLAAAHADGIVHRDLKPANIFVTTGPDGADLVKILDFGIAKLAGHSTTAGAVATRDGALLGTIAYMSPEQVAGASSVDLRSDIYSLGVTLYQLLTGALPYGGRSLPALLYAIVNTPPASLAHIRPEIPRELVQIVEAAMAKNPDERFPNMIVFAAALAPFAASTRSDFGGRDIVNPAETLVVTRPPSSTPSLNTVVVPFDAPTLSRPSRLFRWKLACSAVGLVGLVVALLATTRIEDSNALPTTSPVTTARAAAPTREPPLAPPEAPLPASSDTESQAEAPTKPSSPSVASAASASIASKPPREGAKSAPRPSPATPSSEPARSVVKRDDVPMQSSNAVTASPKRPAAGAIRNRPPPHSPSDYDERK